MKKSQYTDKRFGSLIFNPVIDDPMLEAYPKLHEIVDEPWEDDSAIDSLLRYVVLMYDPNSPLVREESDLNHRMSTAIEVAGIDNTDLVNVIESYAHSFLPDLIYNYLKRFAKSKEFALYSAMEYKFWEAIRMTMTPITGDNSKQQLEGVQKKAIVSDELEKDIRRLETYRREFFGDESLSSEIKKRLTPERMAGLE